MTLDLVSPRKRDRKPARELSPEQAAAAAMVAEAKARGLALTGPDGLLKLFTKNVLETAKWSWKAVALCLCSANSAWERNQTCASRSTRPPPPPHTARR